MNKLTKDKQAQIISALVEGSSIRATARMMNVDKNTVMRLLVSVGTVCKEYQDKVFKNLQCKRIQCDEVWAFCYAKEKNVPKKLKKKTGYGDVWTWTALDAETKLVPSWMLGNRDARTAKMFMEDLAGRMANRIQLTTDGFKAYLQAVEGAFGADIDYGMLIKVYGNAQESGRYSPGEVIDAYPEMIQGKPETKHVSTSFVERQNLNMRMNMRRFTRLTNAFSKKIENMEHAVALHFMYYNFCRIHQTLRSTPAIRAKLTDHVWSIDEIIALLRF